MTNPTPEDFFEAANLLQDVASQYRPVAISSNQSDTDLLAEVVEVIEELSANVQVLMNVIKDPGGGSPLAKKMVLLVAENAVAGSRDFLAKIER